MVFADTKKDSAGLPAGVRDVRAEAGNTIPMVFVTTADGEKGIKGISYAILKEDMRDAVRELKKTLETVDVIGGESDDAAAEVAAASTTEETTSSDSGLLAESQAWTNTDGQTINAAIRKVEGDQVEFLMTDGRSIPYPLAKLSEESRKKIEELQAN